MENIVKQYIDRDSYTIIYSYLGPDYCDHCKNPVFRIFTKKFNYFNICNHITCYKKVCYVCMKKLKLPYSSHRLSFKFMCDKHVDENAKKLCDNNINGK